jgi:hypothetical protein
MENTPKKRCPMRITTRRGSERLILFCGYRNGTGSSQPNARETEVRTTSALAPVFRPVNFDIRPETRIVKQEASVPCHGSACPCGSTSSFPGLFYSVALDLIGGGLMASFGKIELARRIRKIGGWFSFRNDKVLPRSRTLSTNPALKARAGSRFLESLNATPTTAAKDFVGFIGPATISLRR